MSYDLFFRSKNQQQQFTKEDFTSYFQNRTNYQVQGEQAWYGNEDTGVYFVFEYGDQDNHDDDDESEATNSEPLLPITFNLNYFRPHPFGLEAEPEVQAFVHHFDLTVSDPQHSGMGDGAYSREGFLSGWNCGNEFSYRAIMSNQDKPEVTSLPSSTLEQTWRWNLARKAKQAEIGEHAFVPKIMYFIDQATIKTAVAWADGIPILLPKVELLIVPRHHLAPKRWFRAAQDDMILLNWNDIDPLISNYASNPGVLPSFNLFYEETPPQIANLIRNKSAQDLTGKSFSFDQILNQELINKMTA